jgi:hypothetical protein
MARLVGTWHLTVTWNAGPLEDVPIHVEGGDPTFKADGTWSNRNGDTGGWLQGGDQVVFIITDTVGLIYSGTLQTNQEGPTVEAPLDDTVTGIMGYPSGYGGTFQMRRLISEWSHGDPDPLRGPAVAPADA